MDPNAQRAYDRGETSLQRGDNKTAMTLFRTALSLCDANTTGLKRVPYGWILLRIAHCHQHLLEFSAALPILDQALAMAAGALQDDLTVAELCHYCHNFRGVSLSNLGRHTEAIAALELALAIGERVPTLMIISTLLTKTGNEHQLH